MDNQFIKKLLYVMGITKSFSLESAKEIEELFVYSRSHKLYNNFRNNGMDILNIWKSDVIIECALLDSKHFYYNSDHSHWVHVMNEECKSSDYAGALPIFNRTVDTMSNLYSLEHHHVLYTRDRSMIFCTEGTISATHAILYVLDYPRETSILLTCIDLGCRCKSSNGRFVISWSHKGIVTVTELRGAI